MAIEATGGAGISAYGLELDSLLRIILTQLTYQDPLKPVDNYQFVSQLGQFTQIQQTQALSEQVANLLAAQAATQATTLLGRGVTLTAARGSASGTVQSISFASGQPLVTLRTASGETLPNVSIADIEQIR